MTSYKFIPVNLEFFYEDNSIYKYLLDVFLEINFVFDKKQFKIDLNIQSS